MNALEYQEHVKARMADAPIASLRRAMYSREGVDETDRLIERGLNAWAVRRRGGRWATAIVFGTCPSDALRRASAPARMGEEIHGETTEVLPIASGWDEPIEWPFSERNQ